MLMLSDARYLAVFFSRVNLVVSFLVFKKSQPQYINEIVFLSNIFQHKTNTSFSSSQFDFGYSPLKVNLDFCVWPFLSFGRKYIFCYLSLTIGMSM